MSFALAFFLVQDEKIKQILQEVEAMKQRIAELETEVAVLKAESEAAPTAQEKPATPLNFFNPSITVFGNLAGRLDGSTVRSPDGDQVDDHVYLRSAEIDFRAAIDPYADAVTIIALEQEADGGFEVDLEESYAVIKRLPILEDAPLGMKLKAGKFRPPFGIMNQVHLHDLPWTTRPEPVVEYLGTEGGSFFESGWSEVGGGVNFQLPDALTPDGTAVTLHYYAMDTGAIAVGEGNNATIPGHVARAEWFVGFDEENDLNLGTSYYRESGHDTVEMHGLDVMFRHKPDQFQSVVVGGELFYTDRTGNTPWGGFAYVQYQPDWPWYLGVRYDYVQDVDDDEAETRVLGGYVSYYTSEFLRFRLGYEHRWDDVAIDDGNNTLFLELNWVFGAHPTEPFWVNR